MIKKSIYMSKLLRHGIVLGVICFLLIKTIGFGKIALIPFLICGISIVGKDICLLLDKKKQANIFDKIFKIGFLIFWFGVLIFASYLWIKEKRYFSLIYTIPFWLAGFFIIRKYLIPKKDEDKESI